MDASAPCSLITSWQTSPLGVWLHRGEDNTEEEEEEVVALADILSSSALDLLNLVPPPFRDLEEGRERGRVLF